MGKYFSSSQGGPALLKVEKYVSLLFNSDSTHQHRVKSAFTPATPTNNRAEN